MVRPVRKLGQSFRKARMVTKQGRLWRWRKIDRLRRYFLKTGLK